MRRALLVLLALSTWAAPPHARADDFTASDPRPRDLMDAAELKLALRKLQVLGSVLFVGAHPDDENTAFLSAFGRERRLRVAYLSMTRGDGGQNLIGSEAGAALGVIRTHELLQARRIDGAEQFFTRALDFGYSKSPEETLELWGHEAVLGDVVRVIRRFRPDVIVTRFGTDGSGGHGHHTASAILAGEAFRAAGDPSRYPEQLAELAPWKAKRLLWNNWRVKPEQLATAEPPILTVDLGTYNPLLGRAYGEIAGQSRSLHKSQGFGAPERRGPNPNYLVHVDGDPARADPLEGVELGWSRVQGGERVGALLREAEQAFDPDRPAMILPALFRAHAAMAGLDPDPLVESKRRDLIEAIRSAAGLWVEAVAGRPTATPGSSLPITLSLLNRSDSDLALTGVELPFGAVAWLAAGPDSGASVAGRRIPLPANRPVGLAATLTLPADLPISQPYWLRARSAEGSFAVEDASWIGRPENPPVAVARMTLALGQERIEIEAPVVHRWVDPVQGERYRSLEVVPPVTCRFDQGVYLFPDAGPREVRLVVESADPSLSGTARLRLPSGWRATPAQAEVRIGGGAPAELSFRVTPPAGAAAAVLGAEIEVGGRAYASGLQRIDHPHLPIRTLFPPAEARLVRADVKRAGEQIGYLMGSGDAVPEALRQMGFEVTLLSDEDVERTDLGRFQAIVAGVRAYNTRPRLRALQPRLLDYVAAGGRLVVQYQTAEADLGERLGPYPFTLSRERVTVEEAEMRILDSRQPLLNAPNRIGPADFEGWVQERGLYFAQPWDSRYQPVLSSADPGEPPRDGGLLFARHGKGVFIYTGLAWFRQLPAGVPGAYRLFANLVSAVPGS